MSATRHAKNQPSSAPISRRGVLQAGGLGVLSLAVPGIVAARMGQANKAGAAEKSCIFILLCGGPSHLEILTFKGYTNRVSGVAFSPDGQRIASQAAWTTR